MVAPKIGEGGKDEEINDKPGMGNKLVPVVAGLLCRTDEKDCDGGRTADEILFVTVPLGLLLVLGGG